MTQKSKVIVYLVAEALNELNNKDKFNYCPEEYLGLRLTG